tara:strand:- start:236 stop:811 length:576 start_codon:yes stop_codon:yes gene_type:complete
MYDELLKQSLKRFYAILHNKNKLVSVLSSDSKVSLRSIDWFITNYSKKNNTYYLIYETKDLIPTFNEKNNHYRENMNVYHSYKSQLKAYSKQKFDPFCRRDRIIFEIDAETSVETTVGQLNFFRWAIDNLIIDYIEENKALIEDDMNTCLKAMKKEHVKKKGNSRKKRQELSLSATRGLNKNHVPIELEFN